MKNILSLIIGALVLIACSSDDSRVVQPVNENPNLKVVVSATVTEDLNNLLGVSDIITYNISIKNIGDVSLSSLTMSNTFTDLEGNSLTLTSGPEFVSADAGSMEATIAVNETALYSATFTITQNEVNAGGLSFSTTVNATSPEGELITDISDNGDDSDGNTTDDSTETIIEFNPLIISQFHTVDSEGNPKIKYYFDENGQLYKIYYSDFRFTPNPIYNYYFEFDSEQKLTNVTKNDSDDVLLESTEITYDSEGRLASIGDRIFQFVADDPDYYIDHSTFSEEIWTDGDIEYTERYFIKYGLNPPNPIATSCNYSYYSEYNTVTDEFYEYGGCGDIYWNNYDGNVVNDCSDIDCIDFGHDININPLYSSTNLIDIQVFGLASIYGDYSPFYPLFSQNNLTFINYSDPSYIVFNYIFNDNNLPLSSTRQYIDELGPDAVYPYGNYYYQGDEIPE